MRPKGNAAELEQRRRQAIVLLMQGMRPAHVARTVGTTRTSVTRWKHAWKAAGKKGLASKPHLGMPPRLIDRQRQKLVKILKRGARKNGYATELWTLERVAEVIEKHFDVSYHPGHVWRVLRSIGWTSQKPERRARERDEKAIAVWRAGDWPRIKKRPKNRASHHDSG
jgi:transposase